jgi:YVTN family beta-propeller protein
MNFRILGPLEVTNRGREAVLGGGKQRALLAILLLHPNEVVSSDRLIQELWSVDAPPTAAKSLQVHVSRLRRSLGDASPNGTDSVVVTSSGGYLIRVEPGELDRERFERLVEDGRKALAEDSFERAVERLDEALALWRGPPLADFTYESFAQSEIARLEELRLEATEERIEARLALGHHNQVIAELEALVDRHPFRERPRAQLMVALYRAGRQTEALQAYQNARRTLVEEQGIEPGESLRQLEAAILAQDPALARPSAAPTAEARRRARRLVTPATDAAALRTRRKRALLVAGAGLVTLALAVVVVLLTRGSEERTTSALTNDSHAVAVIDPKTNEVREAASVGAQPGPLAFERKSGSLWVANLDDKTVTHIDARAERVGRTIAVGDVPVGLAAGGGAVWVASADRTDSFVTVRKIDGRFDALERTVRVTSLPDEQADVALHGGALWVAPSYGLLTLINPRTGAVRRPAIETGHGQTVVAVGAGSIWVADREANIIVRADPASGATTPIPVGNGPTGIAIGAGAVWVTLGHENSLARIDPQSGAVRRTIRVGRAPTGVAVGERAVWVANSGDGTVSRVDPNTDEVVATVRVGASPQDVVVGGGKVWVSVRPRTLSEVARPGGTVRLESQSDVGSMDPAANAPPLAVQLGYATGARLLNYPDAPSPTGSRVEPEVAQSLPTRSKDGRTYTFRIRPGFRFSPPSNEPVTARTFKYTIERSLDPRMRGSGPAFLGDVVGASAYAAGKAKRVSGVTASGNVLRIRLVSPAPDFPERIALSWFAAVPIGTPIEPRGVREVPSAGPYYVASESPGEGVVLRRNPNYRGGRPHRLREIRLRVGVAKARAAAHVEAGSADYVPNEITPQNAARLAARYGAGSRAARAGRQRYFVNPSLAVDHLALNTSRPLFSSARMRKAVNYAIDRRALARQGGIFHPLPATPTDQYLPPGVPGYRDARIYPFSPDVAAARRLIGQRRRKAVLYVFDHPSLPQIAQIVKTNLGAVGIDVEVKQFPLSVYFGKIATRGEPYDIALASWGVDYPDPANILSLFDGRLLKQTPSYSDSYFDDPAYNRRLAAAASLSGPRRYIAYSQLDLDLARDAAPWAAYANESRHDFFSARIGCQTYQPIYGIDLAALCIRR